MMLINIYILVYVQNVYYYFNIFHFMTSVEQFYQYLILLSTYNIFDVEKKYDLDC